MVRTGKSRLERAMLVETTAHIPSLSEIAVLDKNNDNTYFIFCKHMDIKRHGVKDFSYIILFNLHCVGFRAVSIFQSRKPNL